MNTGISGGSRESFKNRVKVAPGPGWSSVLSKDQTVSLFKEAMTLLLEGGIKLDEMTHVAGLEAPAIEVEAIKTEESK